MIPLADSPLGAWRVFLKDPLVLSVLLTVRAKLDVGDSLIIKSRPAVRPATRLRFSLGRELAKLNADGAKPNPV
jgi:hypothetical protein